MINKSQILDELLVLQAQNGDKEAFSQLVTKWNAKLIYQSQIRTKDIEASKDIVQDVWHWLTSNLGKLKEAAKFGSWIRTIVDRRSIDWVRKEQRDRKHHEHLKVTNGDNQIIDAGSSDYPDPDSDPDEHSIELLIQAMSELEAQSKLILSLYYGQSSSIKSISEILKIPKGTVKSRLYHAREKLKLKLKELHYEK